MADPAPDQVKRNKLIGRTLIVVLGLLALAYLVVTFVPVGPHR